MPQDKMNRAEAAAYQSAAALMLTGFLFAQFSIHIAGLDILIDAVGWLLVFNGLRPLEKPEGGLGPRAGLCLALVAVAGAQIFALGGQAVVLQVMRALLEIGLFISMAQLFGWWLPVAGLPKGRVPFQVILGLNALVSALGGVLAVVQIPAGGTGWPLLLVSGAVFLVRLALDAGLLWLLVVLRKEAK